MTIKSAIINIIASCSHDKSLVGVFQLLPLKIYLSTNEYKHNWFRMHAHT